MNTPGHANELLNGKTRNSACLALEEVQHNFLAQGPGWQREDDKAPWRFFSIRGQERLDDAVGKHGLACPGQSRDIDQRTGGGVDF